MQKIKQEWIRTSQSDYTVPCGTRIVKAHNGNNTVKYQWNKQNLYRTCWAGEM